MNEEPMNINDYESSLWHQERVKQEELQLQEQLKALRGSAHATGSAHKVSMNSAQSQKRPSLTGVAGEASSGGSTLKVSSSTSKLSQAGNQSNFKVQKKQQQQQQVCERQLF